MIKFDEHILLTQLQSGSDKAFETLFEQYSGKLYNFILNLSGRDTYLAEEIVQKTFIKIWETKEYVNPEKEFVSYIYTIAKHMLLNVFEHQTVEFVYREYLLNNSSDRDMATDKVVDYDFLEDFIEKIAEQLPPARKRIFNMSHKEMLTNKEIAQKLNLAESTVQTQMSKAIDLMKTRLREYKEYIIIFLLYHFS